MRNIQIILALVVLSSCTQVVDELIGEENLSISESFNSENYSNLQMKLDDDSYCPGNGIEIEILQNSNNIYSTTVHTLPFNHTIPVNQNSNIEFAAESIDLNNGIVCKRLGNAKLQVFIRN